MRINGEKFLSRVKGSQLSFNLLKRIAPSVVCSHHSSRRSLVSSTSSTASRLQVLTNARAASQEA